MGKKILGGLFLAAAALVLIGAAGNGTLFSDQGSAAATYGNFVGTLIPVVLYVLSGIFLLTFDNPTKMNYIDGFKKRSRQSSKFIFFIAAYAIMVFFASIGAGLSATDNFVLSMVIGIAPYMIPVAVFVALYQVYALPHIASKKYFAANDAALNEYLSTGETFYSYSSDNFVLASSKALYFPQVFCVVPFNQIASTKRTTELWLEYVYFNLPNGKKFYVTTKHYDRILAAIQAHCQAQ